MNLNLTAKRPYIFRAYYDWLLDNNLTPYVLVNAIYPKTFVPQEFVSDDKIVLNISPSAIGNLENNNKVLKFSGRFSGVIRDLHIPFGAIIAIYAKENAEGIEFEPEIQHYNSDILLEIIKEEFVTNDNSDDFLPAKNIDNKKQLDKSKINLKIVK